MSTDSAAVSAPYLPTEVLFKIVSEVAQLRTGPSNDRNRSMPYAEWVESVTAVNRLIHAGGLFRQEVYRFWDPRWTLWRIAPGALSRVCSPPGISGWDHTRNMRYSPAAPKVDSDDQSFVLGGVPDRIVNLPSRTVTNLVLTDDDFRLMMLAVEDLAWRHEVGFRHLRAVRDPKFPQRKPYIPWHWTRVKASEFGECIRKFEELPMLSEDYGIRDDGDYHTIYLMTGYDRELVTQMRSFLRNWPCLSVEHLTVILRNDSCLGYHFESRRDLPNVSRAEKLQDFLSGRYLHLPEAGEMDMAAELLVSLFPRLERLTITRAPISDPVKRAWVLPPPNSKETATCDVGMLAGEPGFDHDDYSRVLIPTKAGIEYADTLSVEEIPGELAKVDGAFLRRVHDKIAERDRRSSDEDSSSEDEAGL